MEETNNDMQNQVCAPSLEEQFAEAAAAREKLIKDLNEKYGSSGLLYTNPIITNNKKRYVTSIPLKEGQLVNQED